MVLWTASHATPTPVIPIAAISGGVSTSTGRLDSAVTTTIARNRRCTRAALM